MSVALYFAVRVHNLIGFSRINCIFCHFKRYIVIAIPAILSQLATPFGNYVLTAAISPFGDNAVAGWALVGRLTVVAFGGIFALSGSIGGIFGQNYGAKQYDRLVTIYRDAMLFCFVYTAIVWSLLVFASGSISIAFNLMTVGEEVFTAFTHVGAGAFIFTGFYFVASAAFNALGKPTRATVLTWLRDGILTWPTAIWLSGIAGAIGVIYAQAVLALVIGVISALLGWIFVRKIATDEIEVDKITRYGFRDIYRFQRR